MRTCVIGCLLGFLAGFFGIPIIPRPAYAAQSHVEVEIDLAKEKTAKVCLKLVQTFGRKRCYFMAKEYLKIGLWLCPDDRKLKKFETFYVFVPELPSYLSDYTWDGFATNPKLRKRKHKRSDDKKAVNAFFQADLDKFMCAHLKRLQAVEGDPVEVARQLGLAVKAALDFAEKSDWIGIVSRTGCNIQGFTIKAKAILEKCGWRKKPRWAGSSYDRWFSPSEVEKKAGKARDKEALARFREKRAQVIGEKYAVLKKDIPVEEISGPSVFEKGLDIKLCKWRSAHFQVEAPLTDHHVKLCLAVQEAGFSAFLNMFRLKDPGRFAVPIKSVILDSYKLYEKYVKTMSGESKEEMEFLIEKTSGTTDQNLGYRITVHIDGLNAALRDELVASPTRLVMQRFGYSKVPLWIALGLEARICLEVLGTSDTGYISRKKTTGRAENLTWFNYYEWKTDMKAAESKGTAPSTQAIFERDNVNELINFQRAKMYCLVDYLILEAFEQFKKLLSAISELDWKLGPDYPALAKAGWKFTKFDEKYKAFITR
jgi:hypothetical protein